MCYHNPTVGMLSMLGLSAWWGRWTNIKIVLPPAMCITSKEITKPTCCGMGMFHGTNMECLFPYLALQLHHWKNWIELGPQIVTGLLCLLSMDSCLESFPCSVAGHFHAFSILNPGTLPSRIHVWLKPYSQYLLPMWTISVLPLPILLSLSWYF